MHWAVQLFFGPGASTLICCTVSGSPPLVAGFCMSRYQGEVHWAVQLPGLQFRGAFCRGHFDICVFLRTTAHELLEPRRSLWLCSVTLSHRCLSLRRRRSLQQQTSITVHGKPQSGQRISDHGMHDWRLNICRMVPKGSVHHTNIDEQSGLFPRHKRVWPAASTLIMTLIQSPV
jgi:hypothetical protein